MHLTNKIEYLHSQFECLAVFTSARKIEASIAQQDRAGYTIHVSIIIEYRRRQCIQIIQEYLPADTVEAIYKKYGIETVKVIKHNYMETNAPKVFVKKDTQPKKKAKVSN